MAHLLLYTLYIYFYLFTKRLSVFLNSDLLVFKCTWFLAANRNGILQERPKTFVLHTKSSPSKSVQVDLSEALVSAEDGEIVETTEEVQVQASGASEEEEEEEEDEEEGEGGTFLRENIFESAVAANTFDEEEVFVNEVTIEETMVKEEPVEVAHD